MYGFKRINVFVGVIFRVFLYHEYKDETKVSYMTGDEIGSD